MTGNPTLSKVTDSDADRPDPDKAPWSLVLTGWAIAIGLTIVQFALMVILDGVAEARLREVIARERPLLWWREDSLGFVPFIVVILTVFLLIPWAYGSSRYGRTKGWPPRRRRTLLIGAAVAIGVASAFHLLFGGRAVGLAFEDDVGWFENGRIVERRPWAAATSVFADCDMRRSGRYNTGELRPTFSYEVSFDGGRNALLSYGGAPSPDWLGLVAPINAKLRAAGVRRRGVVKEACLHEQAEPGMSVLELKALMAP